MCVHVFSRQYEDTYIAVYVEEVVELAAIDLEETHLRPEDVLLHYYEAFRHSTMRPSGMLL